MKTDIRNLIDFEKLDILLEGFNKSTGFVTAILDLDGNILSKSGWRQICTEFHRINPDTSKRCSISDTVLANRMAKGEKYHFYKCLNGLVDVAVPLIINDEHIANLFSGQFFFEKPDITFFKNQAEQYGFDEDKYIAALSSVPVVSEEKVKTSMDFLLDMTQLISDTTFQKLQQIELYEDLRESEEKFKTVFESANVGKSITLPTGEIDVNQAFCDMLGYSRDELRNKKWQEITPEEDIPAIQALTDPLLNGEKDSARFEKRYLCKNGSYLWADVSVSIRRDNNGKSLYFITTAINIDERKQLELELRKFELIAESSSEFIGMCDLNLQPVYVNSSGIRMVGLPDVAEACRVNVQDYFFPEDQLFIAEDFFPRVMRDGEGDVEIRLRHFQTGAPIWVLYCLYRVSDDNDRPIGWATVSRDITERKRVQIELTESETRYRTLFEKMNAGFVLFEVVQDEQNTAYDLIILAANEGFKETTGLNLKDAVGQHLTEVLPGIEKDEADWIGTYSKVALTGEAIQFEQGSELLGYYYSVSAFQAGPKQCAVTFVDITEHMRANESLRKSENRLNRALENIPDEVVIYDKDLKIRYINAAASRIAGRPEAELTGKREDEIRPPEIYQAYLPMLQESLDTGEVRFLDTDLTSPMGGTRSLRMTFLPLFDENGAVLEIMGVTNDYTERKRTEEIVRISRERLLLATEGANIGIWSWNITTGELILSDKSKELFGLEHNVTMSYQRFIDGLHPDDRERTNEAVKDSLENHKIFDLEYRTLWPDNSLHWISAKGRGFYDKNGTAVRMEGVLIDISEHKKVEELNRESAERAQRQRNLIARLTFEKSIVNNDITDALKILTSRLSTAMQVDRISVWMLSGDEEKFQRLALFDSASGFDPQIDVLITAEIPSYFEALRKDSQIGAVDAQTDPRTKELTDNYLIPLRISSLLDSAIQQDGRLIGVLSAEHRGPVRHWHADEESFLSAVANLVAQLFANADRRRVEADLISMSNIMKNSQEIAHLGSFEYVASTQATIWSEEEYRIYGLNPDGPSPEYSVMLKDCIHPDDAELLHSTFTAAIQNQKVFELEHRITRPDGSVRWVYDKAHPYFDENGNLQRYVGATLDITERKHLQQELEILNAELEKKVEQRTSLLEVSNKELEAFSYSVSHDLRSPLRHINGYIDLLNLHYKDILPEKARHYLDTISGASCQMGTLIDDLLQYSRVGRKDLRKSELDMNALVGEVLAELTPVLNGRIITWDIRKLPQVYGDHTLLKQVWANLLDNAVKYTSNQQTAEISVDYTEKENDFVFCVCDNGIGFDMKYVHKLFGVFQRLHSQAEFEGTGIGLANVQRIVQKHMGRIWAEAESGKGAKFYFSLPKEREEI